MKTAIPVLLLVVFATGCSQKIRTGADGTPQFVLAPDDIVQPIDIVTNGVFEMVGTGQSNANGKMLVEYNTNSAPGMTGLRLHLTSAKTQELRHFVHYLDSRAFSGESHPARAEILAGSQMIFSSDDFRISGDVWIAASAMSLTFKSPEEAQTAINTLTAK